MHATTTRADVERAAKELPGMPRDEPVRDSNVDDHMAPRWATVVGRSTLLGMSACTAAGLSQPELMTAFPQTVAAVVLGLCQIGLGEQVVHSRPTLGWRTAFTIDLALLPTILGLWVAADFAQWAVAVAAAALVTAWLCFALLWCHSGHQRHAAMLPRARPAANGGHG